MQKNIIGFIGHPEVCKEAAVILQTLGFFKLEITAKVKEVAKYLLKLTDEEINENTLQQIRNRGYQINQFYWVNLTLTTIPENKDKIVIPDLRIEDVVSAITPYYLGRPEHQEKCPARINFVDISTNLKEKLEKMFKINTPSSLSID